MSKTRSINDLITELQAENESAKKLVKLFNQACKEEFGMNVAELHDCITKYEAYERKKKEQANLTQHQEHQPMQTHNVTFGHMN